MINPEEVELTIPAIRRWLETLDSARTFIPGNVCHCLVAEYLRDTLHIPEGCRCTVGIYSWALTDRRYDLPHDIVDLVYMFDEATPHTGWTAREILQWLASWS